MGTRRVSWLFDEAAAGAQETDGSFTFECVQPSERPVLLGAAKEISDDKPRQIEICFESGGPVEFLVSDPIDGEEWR